MHIKTLAGVLFGFSDPIVDFWKLRYFSQTETLAGFVLTCRGSFSAVAQPIVASHYSFFGIFQDLQDFHTSARLKSVLEIT